MAGLDFSALGELVETVNENNKPASVSENPDREFYQSGVTGPDRQFEPEVLPKRGERGTDVSNMQQALVDAGVTSIRKVDGAFGVNTERGVQEFQEMNGLPETGIFDEATRSALFDDKTRMPDSDEPMVPAPPPVAVTTEADTDELTTYKDEFALDYLKKHEGVKAHKSLEGGKDTAALGVKFSLGLDRKDYASDAEFAGAVALKHRDKAKAKFGEGEWDNLPKSVQYALVDLNYNTGTIGSTADKASDIDMMKNTLDFVGMTTKAGDKASLISLAKRRAWNWNKAAADIGATEIAKIKQIPTASGGTKFEYLDSSGGVVHSLTTSRTPVKLNNSGGATTLTATREVSV